MLILQVKFLFFRVTAKDVHPNIQLQSEPGQRNLPGVCDHLLCFSGKRQLDNIEMLPDQILPYI